MTRLLVVDDSPLMRRLLGKLFEAEADFEVAFARNGAEALAAIESFDPQVVTMDINMPELDGLACLDRIMLEHPRPVVMVSSLTEEGARETLAALDLGAVDFVAKPSGAVSLEMETLGPRIVEKVRGAAQARLPRTRRLAERVRLRTRADRHAAPSSAPPPKAARPRRKTPSRGRSGPGLVLVGTSTGGPAALDMLLGGLPADFPWPIVVAQHMPASFTGQLARRLDRLCALAVREVARPTRIEPGNVYIARGDADAIVSRRGDSLVAMPVPSDPAQRWHPSVERLVDSALEQCAAEALVGVLMTGMGNDGAAALTRLRAAGGRTIAEAEASAVVWGMPGELVRLGGADAVLPVDRIAAHLVELVA